jgi:hypothetical protein
MRSLDEAMEEALTSEELAATIQQTGAAEQSVPALFKAEASRLLTRQDIGKEIPGKGVYIGEWSPINSAGDSPQVYNVFAAPEDLTDDNNERFYGNYNEVSERLGFIKSWHGHDGHYTRSESDLLRALGNDSYSGGWFVPPRRLVEGMVQKKKWHILKTKNIQKDCLSACRDKGDFNGTFADSLYWTSTENPFNVFYASPFSASQQNLPLLAKANTVCYCCRPCRLERRGLKTDKIP